MKIKIGHTSSRLILPIRGGKMNTKLKLLIRIGGYYLVVAGLVACAGSAHAHLAASTNATAGSISGTNLVSELTATVNGRPATIMTDRNGMSLYTFGQDTTNVSNCSGSCLSEWPPRHVPAGDQVLSPFGVINGNDGQPQLTYNSLPLYHYSGDQKPGDVFGQYPGWNAVIINNSTTFVTTSSFAGL